MLMEAVLVDIVSRVVTPRATLAGTACKYHSSHIYFCIRQKRDKTLRNLGVNPEGEPGDDDEHAGGDVDGEHVVRELPLQGQLHQQAAVLPYRNNSVKISDFCNESGYK